MSGAIGFGLILFAIAVLVAAHGQERIVGLNPDDFASLVSLIALGLLFTGWMINQFRGRWRQGLAALLLWAALFVGLMGIYAYRSELREFSARVIGEVAPGQPVVTANGEVVVARRVDGSFSVAGRANGRDVRFIFDTGASMVVLMASTAEALGIRSAALSYTVPVLTANGRTLAAPVVLDSLSVGPITERRVAALVARPGVLHENLLGMSFLDRLASYEVRGNRLILRGRTG
jgi:aspartyl protease family protein